MPQVIGASEYTVSIRASKAGYVTKEISKTVTVGRATTATVTSADKTYNKSEQTGVTGNNVTLTGTTKATNAGTYTAYATPNENYAWSDGTTETKPITWKINTAEITLDATVYTGTYDTKAHNAITSVTVVPEDALLEYALENGEYSTEIPQVTGANTYKVSIRASKTNYTTKEITKTVTVNADTTAPTAPTVVVSSGTAGSNGWYRSNVTVRVTAGSDSDSGVQRVTYALSGATTSAETTITSGGTFTITNEGTTTVTAYTYDNAGNKSSAGELTVKKDATAPGKATINTNGYTAGKYTTSATVSLTASSSDSNSGIDHYEFTINGGSSVASTSNPYSITDNYCSKTVYARAVDKAGNVGPWSDSVVVKKGKTLASVASAGQYVAYNGANWRVYSKNSTTVYLVGVANSSYTLGGKSNYDSAVTLLNNQAATKLNSTYATAARSINLNDNITTLTSYGFSNSWLATQTGALTGNPLMTYYGVYCISSSGTQDYENLACYVHSSATWTSGSYSKKVVAIVTLKANIVTSGTSGGVWQLVAPR